MSYRPCKTCSGVGKTYFGGVAETCFTCDGKGVLWSYNDHLYAEKPGAQFRPLKRKKEKDT